MQTARHNYLLKPRQRGFTLLEVLIAVVVLSIGLLGLAALQANSLRSNQDALMRTQETMLAYDMIDRMRANIPAVNAGNYDLTAALLDGNCTSINGCSPAAMAGNDMFEWNAVLSTALPGGEGVVCLDGTPDPPFPLGGTGVANPDCQAVGNVYVIKLWWDHDRNPATPKQRFETSFLP